MSPSAKSRDLPVRPANSGRYAHIDAMRALAVMLVVVGHAGLGNVVPGGSGVTIFFGISGFIITYLLLKEKARTGTFKLRAFYARRALKILPPLILVVIIPTLVLSFFGPIRWSVLSGIIFFYYNWFTVHGILPDLAGSEVVWSLSIEEQFYLAFAMIWFLALRFSVRTKAIAFLVLATALVSVVIRIILMSSASSSIMLEDRIYYATDTRIDAIAIGVLTAIVYHRYTNSAEGGGIIESIMRSLQSDYALLLAISAFIFSVLLRNEWFRYTFRFSIQASATCVIIVYGFGSNRTRIRSAFERVTRAKIVQFIGLASYSIYLVHLIVMSLILRVVNVVPELVRVGILTLLGTVSGMTVYLAVERPVQRWRTRRSVAAHAD